MSDTHQSSEEEDFCRISDGGHSDHEEENQGPKVEKDATAETGEVKEPEISEYCQVVFHNVSESYKPGKHLECYYTLSPVLVPSSRDYIGVFKVGWNSVRCYFTFEYAPMPKNWVANQEYKQCVIFNSYYLPKEEDGEFYQFCYIDSAGKMRGASTPFQFLKTPMEDFFEVPDESLDILMIQSKQTHNSELIGKLTAERDSIAADKSQMEKEKNQLVGKVEEIEAALTVKEDDVKELTEKIKVLEESNQRIPVLEGKLVTLEKTLANLSAEKKRYEESLQQTTEAFLEVQDNITKLENERSSLKKELEGLKKERDEFKGQFASSEKENETLRNEIDSLKQQLMEANERNQVILAKEGALKEEKQKVEQQLLVASSDQDHRKMLQARVVELESSLARSEEAYRKLTEQLKAMGDVHEKLTNDYEKSRMECDDLKTRITRQGEDFLQKQKKMENHMSLEKHAASEREAHLSTHVQALKDGIQKLAKEKESLVQGRMGSEEASHIAVKSFKDKMQRALRRAEDESQKRLDVQKDLLELKETYKNEKEDLEKQVTYFKTRMEEAEENSQQAAHDNAKEMDSLKVRLEMAKEEYKILYKELRSLEGKDRKGSNKEGTSLDKEKLLGTTPVVEEKVLSASISEEAGEATYDSRDMTLNMEEMNKQVVQLTQELQKRKDKVTQYQTQYEKERMRRKECENRYREMQENKRQKEEEFKKKIREKQDELAIWKDKFNKMHDDYLRVKHANESFRFDMQLAKSPDTRPSAPVPQPRSFEVAPSFQPRPPPLKYPNPYESSSSDESLKVVSPPGRYAAPQLRSLAAAAAVTESQTGFPSLEFKRPPGKLPEPLIPQKTPEAKFVATKASLSDKHDGESNKKPSAPPMVPTEDDEDIYGAGSDDGNMTESLPREIVGDGIPEVSDRCPSPTVYHDAPEYPPSRDQKCPNCSIVFGPRCTDEDLAKHIQSHFTWECPQCKVLFSKEDERVIKSHQERCQKNQEPPQQCPVCSEVCSELTPGQFQEHVNRHFE